LFITPALKNTAPGHESNNYSASTVKSVTVHQVSIFQAQKCFQN